MLSTHKSNTRTPLGMSDRLAQWLRRSSYTREIAGSNPASVIFFFPGIYALCFFPLSVLYPILSLCIMFLSLHTSRSDKTRSRIPLIQPNPAPRVESLINLNPDSRPVQLYRGHRQQQEHSRQQLLPVYRVFCLRYR